MRRKIGKMAQALLDKASAAPDRTAAYDGFWQAMAATSLVNAGLVTKKPENYKIENSRGISITAFGGYVTLK